MPEGDPRISLTVVQADAVDDPVILRVYVANWSEEPVVINRRFALGHRDSEADISLDIVGPDGEQRPLTTRIRLGEPADEDFLTVDPYCGVGRDLVIEPDTDFDLSEPGSYEVRAFWSNRYRQAPIESNRLLLSLKEAGTTI